MKAQQSHEQRDFGYLDYFEQNFKNRNQIEQEVEKKDTNTPQFFQKEGPKRQLDWKEEEAEAHKKFSTENEIDFLDDKMGTHEGIKDHFRIPSEKTVVEDMTQRSFESLKLRLKDRQINFYAFLNKEFNVMNYKSAKCSMHCYEDQAKSVN